MTDSGVASTLDVEDFGFSVRDHRTPPPRRQVSDPATIPVTPLFVLFETARVRSSGTTDGARSTYETSWLSRAQERVDGLLCTPTNAQPTSKVGDAIKAMLAAFFITGTKPNRIVATAQGGISLWFQDERRKAQLEVSNDDPTVAVFALMNRDAAPLITEIYLTPRSILDATARLQAFLQG